MRFLGITETCDLGALYMRLLDEGHEVKVFVSEPLAKGTMRGIIEHCDDWCEQLDWIGRDGIIIFEAVSEGFGALQDELREQGYNVIGGSAFGDRLENDRAFAQQLLEQLGFPSGLTREYDSIADAKAFIQANPGRYVLKFSGGGRASHDNYVGMLPDGSDVIAMLEATASPGEQFVLQDFIDGIEMGVGAYFNGDSFLEPACLDWEHKRFFPGDLGELTGEMGTVATFDRSGHFFARTLRLIEPHLRAARHVGYVNLNTIVNERGIVPLEFTCRFGYPGFAVLTPLQETSWGDLLQAMISGQTRLATVGGFVTGVVVTTPPFPYSRHDVDERVGLPVLIEESDSSHLHFGEVGREGGQFVTSGVYGWTMVVTGKGATVAASADEAYRRLDRVFTPHMRYRQDIGRKLAGGDLDWLQTQGWLG